MADKRRAVHLAAAEPLPREPEVVEPISLRDVMSQFATGITVLTAGGDHSHGMTANAFTSVSLDPPLVLCCIARTAVMHEAIMATKSFAVSMLEAGQEELARYFANKGRPRGPAQFEAVTWCPGPRTGAPLLAGSLAWLECELEDVYHGGDHAIFLGRVLSAIRGSERQALLFFGGSFHQVVPPARGTRGAA